MDRLASGLPPLARQKALALGPAGRAWLDELPDVLEQLRRRWSLTFGGTLPGGSAAFVARARTAEGHDVVVKVAVPGEDVAGEVPTLRAARGRGYVELLAHDAERNAMLLEALGPSLASEDLSTEATMAVLVDVLRVAWTVPRRSADPPRDKAAELGRLVERLWQDHDRPCPTRVVEVALTCAGRRAAAFDPDRCVVVHGDPHADNALRVRTPRAGAESGYVFVDPDCFLGDPAYDLGVVLRDGCDELLAAADAPALVRHWCRLLADRSGLDGAAVREWGFLERVSTGLYLLSLGADVEGRRFLDTAERLT